MVSLGAGFALWDAYLWRVMSVSRVVGRRGVVYEEETAGGRERDLSFPSLVAWLGGGTVPGT